MSDTDATTAWKRGSLNASEWTNDLSTWRRYAAALLALITACGLAHAIATGQWLVVGAVIAIAILVLWPIAVAVGLYVFVMPLDGLAVPGGHGTLTSAAGAFAGAVLLIYGLGSGRLRALSTSSIWWGLFALWSAISLAWAIDEKLATSGLSSVLGVLGLFGVAAGMRFAERELRAVSSLAILGGAIAGVLLIIQGPLPETEERATVALAGQMLNPNQVANGLLIPFVLALGSFFSVQRLFAKVLPLAALTLIGTGIFLTGSRGALLSIAVAMVVFALRAGASKRLLAPLVVLGIVLCFLPLSFFQRVRNAATDRGTGRVDIFIAGIQVVKNNPVLGVGLANFPVAYAQYAGFAPVFRGYDRAAHNGYLEVCGETGLIGLALFLAAMLAQLKISARMLAHALAPNYLLIAAEASCYGLLVYGCFGSIQWRKSFWLGWMLLAIVTRFTATGSGLTASSSSHGRLPAPA